MDRTGAARCKRFGIACAAAIGIVVAAPGAIATRSFASGDQPLLARSARVLGVRDEGRLHFVKSSGSLLIDEGPASGTLPGKVRVRFTYNGNPQVTARFTIYGTKGTISGTAHGRLNNPTSPNPSFRGSLTITAGSGRYADARGNGELFGVFYRRSYALTVQAVSTLRY